MNGIVERNYVQVIDSFGLAKCQALENEQKWLFMKKFIL